MSPNSAERGLPRMPSILGESPTQGLSDEPRCGLSDGSGPARFLTWREVTFSRFRARNPKFWKKFEIFFSNFGNTHGGLPNDAKNLGQPAFFGQIKQLWKNGRFGPWNGVPNLKGPYLGLGGMWPKNSFAGLLLVPMGSPQATRIGVTGFWMEPLFWELGSSFC